MGLLGSLAGALLGGSGKGADSGLGAGQMAKLVPAAIKMLSSIGLPKLIEMFDKAGLDDVLKSWLSKGKNLPVSADQLTQALGSGVIGNLAKQIGAKPAPTAGALSQYLPSLVDALSPDGSLDESRLHQAEEDGGSSLKLDGLMGMLGSVLK